MNLLRRKAPEEKSTTVPADDALVGAGKGRPTPKRRTKSTPPAPAPRTRKEAAAWQKRQRKTNAGAKTGLSGSQYRDAVKAGDPRALPRRDQGPVRALARDYVDTHRMLSNGLLGLFLLFILGYILPVLQYITIALFLVVLVEWYRTGSLIRKMATQRGLTVRDSALGLGFYAGSRAYMPRSWRRPAPNLKLGDKM